MDKIKKLIGDALWICKEYEKVSPPFLQRKLMLDGDTAEKLFAELEDMEVIVHAADESDGEETVRIGDIDTEKLLEYLKN